ncbi:chorismate-binding protein [Ruania alba]|uniref:Para-aminobenzoate synthetase component 1 n=1 Tax=Ruania alba TaxID=648782 RepID=A0A1H5FN01_9MICO|nr:anthranilate synthase component I family protein [Ruania alba]SEE04815.1 para-aminobenzoate synthetase component 1 [Ruania alba]
MPQHPDRSTSGLPERSPVGARHAVPWPGRAWFRGVHADGVAEYANLSREPDALARGGWWAVVAEFEGDVHAWRFSDVVRSPRVVRDAGTWRGPDSRTWTSSMDRPAYTNAVRRVRAAIREGEVYQANICRVLTAPLPERPDAAPLAVRLAHGNPAPYAALLDIPGGDDLPGSWVVSASPELSVEVVDGHVLSGPIKGTAAHEDALLEKDRAENVMITDLVRNDLQRVCAPGTVTVTDLLRAEKHPGLVHLVSRVRGELMRDPALDATGWPAILAATHPPGSVSGAPKSSALRLISQLETAARGPYCGQIGWIDADRGTARLAVGIRTFWWSAGTLAFGTGAGITWGSDPAGEWAETELKAARLLGLASR